MATADDKRIITETTGKAILAERIRQSVAMESIAARGKLAGFFSINKVMLDMTLDNSTEHILVNRAGDGAVTAVSDNPEVVSVSVNGTDIVLTALSTGTANVTIGVLEGTKYSAPNSKVVPVSVRMVSTTLENTSWAEIAKAGYDGVGANYWDVGDMKSVNIDGTIGTLAVSGTYYVFIIEFNYRGDNGVYFQGFKTADGKDTALVDGGYGSGYTNGNKYFNANHWGDTSYGGWKGCDMRYDILGSTRTAPSGYGSAAASGRIGYDAIESTATDPVSNTLMAALPNDLRVNISPWTIYTDNISNGTNSESNISMSIDYLPLLADYEIHGSVNAGNTYEPNYQTQMSYYANGNSKVKYRHSNISNTSLYLERSPYRGASGGFCATYTDGSANFHQANYSWGIAPAFRLSKDL